MNWVGGNLQRHSRNKNNAVVERQKSHFAKVRNKAQNRSGPSSLHWDHAPSTRLASYQPYKRDRKRLHHSNHIQRNTPHEAMVNFAPPLQGTKVKIRVGKRAFDSQPDTTIVAHSTNSRPASTSSEFMLLDEFDQTRSVHEVFEDPPLDQNNSNSPMHPSDLGSVISNKSHLRILQDQDHKLLLRHARYTPLRVSDEMLLSGNDSPTSLVSNTRGTPHGNGLQSDRLNVSGLRSKRADKSALHANQDSSESDHKDSEDNTWRRFIQEERVAPSESGVHAALHSPCSYSVCENAQKEPLYPVSISASTPHSPCPTGRACVLKLGPLKRTGGETDARIRRLDDDEKVWKTFILGSGDTDSV